MPAIAPQAPTIASHGLTSDGGIGIDRPGAVLQLAGEAVVQARELGLLRLAQVEVGEQPPEPDRQVAHERLLDLAEPAHEPGRQPPRNAVGQQEIEVFLLEDLAISDADCHGIGKAAADSAAIRWIRASRHSPSTRSARRRWRRRWSKLKTAARAVAAKHRSLAGHARMARRIAALVPFYEYDEARFFRSDDAPDEVAARRARRLRCGSPRSTASASRRRMRLTAEVSGRHLRPAVHRRLPRAVPVQPPRARAPAGRLVRAVVRRRDGHRSRRQPLLRPDRLLRRQPVRLRLLQGLHGRAARARARARARCSAPIIRSSPTTCERLQEISGLDEVSFHMSGTEAVMQAVRLARYHTAPLASGALLRRLSRLVGRRAAGRRQSRAGARDLHAERHVGGHAARAAQRAATSPACWSTRCRRCIRTPTRRRIPRWSTARRSAHFDRAAYADWLRRLRAVCTRARHRADLRRGVRRLPPRARRRAGIFRRRGRHGDLRQDARRRPAGRRGVRPQGPDEALPRRPAGRHLLRARHLQLAPLRDGARCTSSCSGSRRRRSARSIAISTSSGTSAPRGSTGACATQDLPVQVANLSSIWTVCYTQPSRYNWMLQYYLRAEGLALSWIGTGRLIFSLNYTRRRFRGGRRPLRRRRQGDAAGRLVVVRRRPPPTSRSSGRSCAR